jgi:L-cysteine S-thiosulfotransferase
MALYAVRVHSQAMPATVSGELGTLPHSLTGQPGNVAQGRLAVADREGGNCLLCHKLPLPQERFQGW